MRPRALGKLQGMQQRESYLELSQEESTKWVEIWFAMCVSHKREADIRSLLLSFCLIGKIEDVSKTFFFIYIDKEIFLS